MRLAGGAAVLLVLSAFAVVALGHEGRGRAAQKPMAVARAATGSLSLEDSRGGGAILSVAGLAPGHSTAGELTITNSGTLDGTLELTSTQLSETPGQGGGLLSQRLRLVVRDLDRQRTLYAGPMSALGERDLGRIEPGAARSFRFTATLPDGGQPPGPTTGDNAYQGASVTSTYVWTATESETSGDSGGPTPDDSGGARPDDAGGATGPSEAPDDYGGATGRRLSMRVRVARIQAPLSRRRVVFYVKCNQSCTVLARAAGAGPGRSSRLTLRVHVSANRRAQITVRLSRRAARRIARALRRHGRARLTVGLRARGADDQVTAFTAHLRLSEVRRGGTRRIRARW
jgi:hypothetical protein